ncbi:MAG: dockerin type I repeat-containing protein [Ruminococcus sp.]|nr:dockerin type I repeat-containing protein [Ruminococcus sp.]
MKKLLSSILVLLVLMPMLVIGAGAATLEEELSEQMFEYFGGEEVDLSYLPPDTPSIFIEAYVEVDDTVIFNAYAVWMGADCAEIVERYGDCCVWSGGINYPSFTAMFVRKDGKIYTLKEAWDSGVINDLSPAVGFSKYTRIYEVGDVDLDYQVSVLDATLIQRRVAQLGSLSDIQVYETADVDDDNEISVLDATSVQMKLSKSNTQVLQNKK